MPRYFIDVRSRFGRDEDPAGIDLPDADAAYGRALEVAQGLRERWSHIPAEARRDIAIEVVDEAHRIVLTVPFWEIEQRLQPLTPRTDTNDTGIQRQPRVRAAQRTKRTRLSTARTLVIGAVVAVSILLAVSVVLS